MEHIISERFEINAAEPATAKPVTRWKAAAIHLSICLLVALFVFALMRFVWYPTPYFEALDAGGLLLILLGVDVVIGPLITLIIFNPAKKNLKFDLTVVALLRLTALLYGMHVVFAARPVYVVFNVDRFDMVTASDIPPEELKKVTREEFKSLPLTGPRLVAADPPADPKERERIMFSAVFGGPDLPAFPQYYVPYRERTAQVLARAKPPAELRKRRPGAEADLARLEDELGLRSDDNLAFLPVRTGKQDLTAIIDLKSGEVVKVLLVDPGL